MILMLLLLLHNEDNVKLANVVAELYPELRDTLRHAGKPLMNLILQQNLRETALLTLELSKLFIVPSFDPIGVRGLKVLQGMHKVQKENKALRLNQTK